MLSRIVRLTLVSIIAVQAYFIHEMKSWRELEAAQSKTLAPEEAKMLRDEATLKAVIAIKDKLIAELEEKVSAYGAENREMRDALTEAYLELERFDDELLVSFGTVEETGYYLAEISSKIKDDSITGDELNALLTLVREIQFLDQTPGDYAIFHATFLGQVIDLEHETVLKVYETLNSYAQLAHQNGYTVSQKPRSSNPEWEQQRAAINEQASEALGNLLNDVQYEQFLAYYPNGVLNTPEFGIQPISRPIILSKEDYLRAGGQVFVKESVPEVLNTGAATAE